MQLPVAVKVVTEIVVPNCGRIRSTSCSRSCKHSGIIGSTCRSICICFNGGLCSLICCNDRSREGKYCSRRSSNSTVLVAKVVVKVEISVVLEGAIVAV